MFSWLNRRLYLLFLTLVLVTLISFGLWIIIFANLRLQIVILLAKVLHFSDLNIGRKLRRLDTLTFLLEVGIDEGYWILRLLMEQGLDQLDHHSPVLLRHHATCTHRIYL